MKEGVEWSCSTRVCALKISGERKMNIWRSVLKMHSPVIVVGSSETMMYSVFRLLEWSRMTLLLKTAKTSESKWLATVVCEIAASTLNVKWGLYPRTLHNEHFFTSLYPELHTHMVFFQCPWKTNINDYSPITWFFFKIGQGFFLSENYLWVLKNNWDIQKLWGCPKPDI